MDKKKYLTPEIEELDLMIESCLISTSGSDPEFDPDPIQGGIQD